MSAIIYGSNRKSKEKPPVTKETPFKAKLKERRLLNDEKSCKKTFHLSLDISESSIKYKEGDAVAVFPKNPKELVCALITRLQCDPTTPIQDPKSHQLTTLEDYLYYKANLSKITSSLLEYLSEASQTAPLQFEDKEKKNNYITSHDVLSCVSTYSLKEISPQKFIQNLLPMTPRFYSIASSQEVYPNEIHLLVATFSYSIQGSIRTGIGSHFLCYEADGHTSIPIYVQENSQFFLPSNPQIPIIMIGPGTGVAPYRAFLQKRSLNPHGAQQWLFFGECNRAYDFYYQEEFDHYLAKGLLRLTTAFSRDQEHKIYVQHQMHQHARELWEWIHKGAFIYLCGDAKHMAKDVTSTLIEIFQSQGGLSPQDAKAFLSHLRKEKRFQSDVY